MIGRGFDLGLAAALLLAPPLVTGGWLYMLSGRVEPTAALAVWVLAAFAARPAVWRWAAYRPGMPAGRAKAYRERGRASVNTAFLATVIMGLGAMDVVPLPRGPYWTDQPRAGFALVAVVIYVVWLSQSADIPAEVKAGYGALFGKRQEGRHV